MKMKLLQQLRFEHNERGFTMLDMLLVLGVFGVLIILSLPALRGFQKETDLTNTVAEVVSILRVAHSRTVSSEGDIQHGVYFNASTSPHQYTLFRGASYASRTVTFDEVYELPDAVNFSIISFGGGKELVFDRITGNTSQSGSTVLILSADSTKTETIYVESSGNIEVGSSVAGTDTDRVKDSRHMHVDYNGRAISTATETITLDFSPSPTTQTIVIIDNMSGGQILWEGTVLVDGKNQGLKVHTHKLNDGLDSQFSIHRDRRFNTKPMKMTISGDGSGKIIEYDAAGTIVTGGESIYVATTTQQ